MCLASNPSWIVSTLRSRATFEGATITSVVSWSSAEKITLHVRVDSAAAHADADYAWKVDKASADKALDKFAQLRAKRGGSKGALALTLGEGSPQQAAEPVEVAARDAITRASHLEYSQALTVNAKVEELSARGDVALAIDAARVGIAALGELYSSPGLDDDTDMKLITGNDAADKGHPAQAFALIQGVLQARLEAYRKLRTPTSAR
jgi:hypothetical protein